MMDRDFHLSVLRQKVDRAKSNDPRQVFDSIDDIRTVLALIEAEDEYSLDTLEGGFEVADVALGLGDERLESAYAQQVLKLIDDFAGRAEGRLLN